MSFGCEAAAVELVVDRVEDGVAAVEVPGGRIVDVLTLILPSPVGEGDRIRVCLVEAPVPVSSTRTALGRVARAECPKPSTESTCQKK